MEEKCPVCSFIVDEGTTKCENCGFVDELGINREWPIIEDANHWLETVVKPYRLQWEAKKREAEVYYDSGVYYYYKNKDELAIKFLTEAIRLNKAYVNAYNDRAKAYNFKKEYDIAIKDFNKVIRLDPNYVRAYFGRGYAYMWKDQYDLAISDFDEAIRLDPNSHRAYSCRGQVYRLLGQKDKAIQDFEKAISLDPNYQWAKDRLQEIQEIRDTKTDFLDG
jgi:tetratricopeptide (TPR) repeat protein